MMRLWLALVNRILIRFLSVGRGTFTWLLLKTDETVEIGYWKIRGLGAPLRMMCEYAGAAYVSTAFEVVEKADGSFGLDSWFKDKKPELLKLNALTNLPYVRVGNVVVSQSNACFTHLGRRFGLMGATEEEASKNEQCLCQIMDLRNDAVGLFYSGFAADKVTVFESKSEGYYTKKVPVHFSKFEHWLQAAGTTFLVADSPQVADFHLWEMLDQHEALGRFLRKPSLLEAFPLLKRYYADFKALPQLQAYFAGPQHALPINNKMAVFGSTPL
ncbi:glutathione-s-transferase [Pavlovales sp. CCMP2436]|nr:glutathione-s-transferase [Pavlovales sp. CCMP2436]|mmetsp:Transcript_36940/g.91921  ORF Transcript_36940/g.91921 Transcript_36940/m.91921 type:complete len:272 (-) Transcript_36940:75-890(-)